MDRSIYFYRSRRGYKSLFERVSQGLVTSSTTTNRELIHRTVLIATFQVAKNGVW